MSILDYIKELIAQGYNEECAKRCAESMFYGNSDEEE